MRRKPQPKPKQQPKLPPRPQPSLPLSAATPEDALSRVVTNRGTKVEDAAKNAAKDAAAGNFTFSFKTNLKVEAKVVVTTKIDMMGTTNTSRRPRP